MPRFLIATSPRSRFLVLLSAIACGACGDVTLPDSPAVDAQPGTLDAQPGTPDAQPGTLDAQPGTPDAQLGAPDARVPDAGTPPDARPPCVEGNAQIEDPDTGACYTLFTTPITWNAAAAACASLGPTAHLVALTSLAEHELVLDLTVGFEAWLGATDASFEGEFVWVTGELVEFDVWAANEPNNGGTNGEDCAIMLGLGTRVGFWDDRACGAALPYVCERE